MKKKIGLIFGGPSPENEISIISAKSIFENLNRDKYEVFLILMTHENKFILIESQNQSDSSVFSKIKSSSDFNLENIKSQEIYFVNGGVWLDLENKFQGIDCIFNIIHGHIGETGELSGFFETLKIPHIGSNVKSSSVLMDKEFSNIIAMHHGISVLEFEIAYQNNVLEFEFYEKKLRGLPFFIKASNAGSSRGVYKISNKQDFEKALSEVFCFDKKIIIQRGLELPAEIELAVFVKKNQIKGENELKIASSIGEIKPSKKHGFYSYEAKYFDQDSAKLVIDPTLKKETREKLFEICKKLYQIFDFSFGRIDFLLDSNEEIYFNEINTLPGFTSISMFPSLFNKSDFKYSELLDELIENCQKM
jgi:D-alanine-D-alanine ligase